MTLRRTSSRLLLAVAGLVLVAGPAQAQATRTSPADVAQALRSDPVFVEDDAELRRDVDVDRLRRELGGATGSPEVYVAVVAQAAADNLGSASTVASRIGAAGLPDSAVVLVVAGREFGGAAGPGAGLARGEAGRIAERRADPADVTSALVRAVVDVRSAAADGPPSGSAIGDQSGGGTGAGVVLAVLGAAAAVGGGLLFARTRKRRLRALEEDRADVESLYNRLGSDVSTLQPGDDPVARQALQDAAERYGATGAILAKSDTPGEFAAARRTAIEGLTAARVVRQKLGLDPGPELPLPSAGPQLTGPERFQVGDQQVEGAPDYAPGRGHYYPGGNVGGRYQPGGWYSFPFWETLLMTSVLTGGFGGGGLFGGGGYERGYEQGVEDSSSGGGGGGLGDWGGGGGDWGGGGGGGGGGDSW